MTKTFKQFLKPDRGKVIVFIILFILGIVISILSNSCLGCYNVSIGLPLSFYEKIVWPPEMEKTDFLILNLIVDIIVIYLLTCLLSFFWL